MKIVIFGTGYVGLVSGTCFSELGNQVTCFDIDQKKIDNLKQGILPIYEPGLGEMVESNAEAKRLHFTTDTREAMHDAEIAFLAVGTPQGPDGSANLDYIMAAAESIASNLTRDLIVATKSTVPVGTADKIREIFKAKASKKFKVDIVSNPEFLREGAAVKDFLNPERVIVGIDNPALQKVFTTLYSTTTRADRPLIFMDVRSAELTKYAANAFLATKISFINGIANLCEKVGADVNKVSYGMGWDSRIGSRFLHAGIGYGGSCFPKDVRALHTTAKEHGFDFKLLTEVEAINNYQKKLPLQFLSKIFPSLKGKTIAIWGLTFKPRTNDVRESPALSIIPDLIKAGARIQAFDPKGMNEAQELLPLETVFCHDALNAVKGADALLLLTEWDEFRTVDLAEIKQLMRGNYLFDGRNIYTASAVEAAGFTYQGVGLA